MNRVFTTIFSLVCGQFDVAGKAACCISKKTEKKSDKVFTLLTKCFLLSGLLAGIGIPITAEATTEGPSYARLAAVASLNAGADLFSKSGVTNALGAPIGVHAFASAQGKISKYDTGSTLKMKGAGATFGIAKNFELESAEAVVAAFVEVGGGDYDLPDNYNDSTRKNDGKVKYYGGGLLFKIGGRGELGAYAGGSFRAGNVQTDWKIEDRPQLGSYNLKNHYMGAHVGVGYGAFYEDTYVDVYAKYFWTRQAGKKTSVGGFDFDFKTIDSHRTRVGIRLTNESDNGWYVYDGLFWEQEFGTKSKASIGGVQTPYTPKIRGATGTLEIGARYKPRGANKWGYDINLSGSLGKQRGGKISVNALHRF